MAGKARTGPRMLAEKTNKIEKSDYSVPDAVPWMSLMFPGMANSNFKLFLF